MVELGLLIVGFVAGLVAGCFVAAVRERDRERERELLQRRYGPGRRSG